MRLTTYPVLLILLVFVLHSSYLDVIAHPVQPILQSQQKEPTLPVSVEPSKNIETVTPPVAALVSANAVHVAPNNVATDVVPSSASNPLLAQHIAANPVDSSPNIVVRVQAASVSTSGRDLTSSLKPVTTVVAKEPSSTSEKSSGPMIGSTKNKKRISIFSVIHPALHAAFSQEKPSSIPPLPLTDVNYRSFPLRGTELRDRTAIGLAASQTPHHLHAAPVLSSKDMSSAMVPTIERTTTLPLQSNSLSSASAIGTQASTSLSDMPSPAVPHALAAMHTNALSHDATGSGSAKPDSFATTAPAVVATGAVSTDALPQHGMGASLEPASAHDAEIYASTLNGLLTPQPAEHTSDTGYALSAVGDKTTGVTAGSSTTATTANVVNTPPPLDAASAFTGMWRSLVSTVRRSADALGLTRAMQQAAAAATAVTAPAPLASSTPAPRDYSEQDVTNLVNDILHEIQMQHDEMRAHRDMLANTGRWTQAPVGLATGGSEGPNVGTGGGGGSSGTESNGLHARTPMLVMRTSLLVPPDLLAEAVTTSTKRMLDARQRPMPWSSASRLLTDVHMRLAQMLEPGGMDGVSTPVQAMTAVGANGSGDGSRSGGVGGVGNNGASVNKNGAVST